MEPAVGTGQDGPVSPTAQGEQDGPAGGRLSRVGQQAQQHTGEQGLVAGDQKSFGARLIAQLDAGLSEQGGSVLRCVAAQAGQIHGHRGKGHPGLGLGIPQELQVVDQAEHLIKVAVDGGQPPVGGGAGAAQVLGEELKVVQQPPHLLVELAGKAVHLLGGEGGVRGGAEQEQHPSGGRDLGKDEQAAAAGESSRSLSTVQRGSQVLGAAVPHGQLWQVTGGRRDLSAVIFPSRTSTAAWGSCSKKLCSSDIPTSSPLQNRRQRFRNRICGAADFRNGKFRWAGA